MTIDLGASPTVYLPVDFDGPICAKCVHCQPSKPDDLPANGHNWTCRATEREVLRPREMNPVTGEIHEARLGSRPLCKDRNRLMKTPSNLIELPGGTTIVAADVMFVVPYETRVRTARTRAREALAVCNALDTAVSMLVGVRVWWP